MTKEKLNIPYPIVVEGKYDRERLMLVADARIIKTDGFGIFKKHETMALIRALAKKSKIIVLADSDGAGKLIRSHITSAIGPENLIQLYIPRIEGKEKRKSEPSKEGTLGVEGMERDLLYGLMAPYAVDGRGVRENLLTKTDLYNVGLSGAPDSAARRDQFASALGLPPGMTANALLAAAGLLVSREEFYETAKNTFGE